MATWFAQNSTVNIDSVNQWNSAANGSGSWLTWASLGASDVLVANNKSSITINVSFTCATITTAATGGTAGGGFLLSAGVTVTANIETGTTTCVTVSAGDSTIIGNLTGTSLGAVHAVLKATSGTLSITGNCSGGTLQGGGGTGSQAVSCSAGSVVIVGNVTGGQTNNQVNTAVNFTSSGGLTVTGNVIANTLTTITQGPGGQVSGIVITAGTLTVTGNVTGGVLLGSSQAAHGVSASTNLDVTITGTVTGGNGVTACGVTYSGTGRLTVNGTMVAGVGPAVLHLGTGRAILSGNATAEAATGGAAFVAYRPLIHASSDTQHTYRVDSGGGVGTARSLYTGGTNLGQPTVANVRLGTTFGASSEYTGTLAVPSPTLVAIGVSTDNTVGSYAPTGGLDAAGVRTAIGLATANLDTQLSGIQSDTNDIQTRLPAALESGRIAAVLDSATRVKLDAVQPDYAPLLASGYTAPANSDITAIKAKTDNLPSDPADQSLIIVATDAVMARLGAPAGLSMSADLAAVKLETGTTLPAQIAALNNLSSAQVVSALGSGTWATALPWNAAWDSEVQSEVQDAIEVNNLDHLLKIAVDTNFATTVHLDSVIGNIADNGTTATFVRTTDSLEAIRDNQSSSSGASLEDIIAGVQSVSGGIIAAQDSSAFYITSGDTWTQDVDALGNIVGKTLVFTIKRNARDADTAALVLINSTDGLTRLSGAAASNSAWGSLTVLNSTLGNIRLTLKSDATLLLKSGTYSDGIKSLEVGDDMTLRQRGKTIISVGVINDIS